MGPSPDDTPTTGTFFWLDPTVAAIIAVLIGYHAAHLIHQIGVYQRLLAPSPLAFTRAGTLCVRSHHPRCR